MNQIYLNLNWQRGGLIRLAKFEMETSIMCIKDYLKNPCESLTICEPVLINVLLSNSLLNLM